MTTIVVIPAYNEAATLRDVVRGALLHADSLIVVDDGSTDGSTRSIDFPGVQVIVHARNEGKSASLIDGFVHALGCGATRVVTMDADGQHGAVDISRLLRAADAHPSSIIIGARTQLRAAAPRARRIANTLADFGVSWASGHRVLDSQSGQRVYPAALLRALDLSRLSRDGFVLESEIVIAAARIGCTAVSVPIDAVYAAVARKSYFRPVRHIAGIFLMLARNVFGNALNLPGLRAALFTRAVTFDDRDAAVVRATALATTRSRETDTLHVAPKS